MSALGKEAVENNRVPNGYFTLPRAAVSPRQILCRVPDKRPSAKTHSPTFFSLGFFTEGCPRQILRRRLKSLCRGLQALGKDPASSSDVRLLFCKK